MYGRAQGCVASDTRAIHAPRAKRAHAPRTLVAFSPEHVVRKRWSTRGEAMSGIRVWLWCVVLAASTLVVPRAWAETADRTLSPYLVVEHGDPNVDHLPLQSTRVEIAVTNVIAEVIVSQVYKNDGRRPINARYVFPASTRAAVHGMRMVI